MAIKGPIAFGSVQGQITHSKKIIVTEKMLDIYYVCFPTV